VFLSFISLEIISLVAYVLVVLDTDATLRTESSLKYFILGSCASAILLFGICLFYILYGSLHLSNTSIIINYIGLYLERMSEIVILLMICAIAFKLGIFPFH